MMDDAHYRSLDLKKPKKVTDWTAKTITLTVVRPQEAQQVQPDRAITLNTDEHLHVQVDAHPAFKGSVRLISTQNENSKNRSKDESNKDLSKSPKPVDSSPAFFADPASIIDFSKGHQSDLGLDALEIFIDSGTRGGDDQASQVSADQPLNITINHTLDTGEHIIPYTHDGEYYLPVGYSSTAENGQTIVHIEHLPESASTKAVDTRSLGSALKIYFRKLIYRDLLGRDTAIHTLGIPQFDEHDPTQVIDYQTDKSIITAQVAKADKVLLIIHGIIGESRTMAGFVNHQIAEGKCLSDEYDLVLGFDYENLNSRIQDIAQALKQELADVGITAGGVKQVDIVAHSMGGLVSRWFIEREGGDAVIRKLVMVGTPNGGSPYANVKAYGYDMLKTWAYSNLVVALNGMIPAYASGAVVGGLVKILDAVDNTLDQMSPDSDFINEIHHSQRPPIPYALIAGRTNTLELTESNANYRIARLFDHLKQRAKLRAYDLLTDKLFNEPNDVAVSFSSMTQFNPQWRDDVMVEQVGCDHLSYFGDEVTIRKIAHYLDVQ
uniref:PGAP1-like protein n=1 Tax=uncultured Thiotrichaceae bacterium TaxID=298394 RepID=A0A6S6UIM9_9GAMM|nr:MAG: PGAP1-like protein [uncultured Thiotrichaceae bacterium]